MNNNQFDLRNCNSPEDLIKCLGSIKANNQRKDHLKCVIYIRKSRIISGKEHYSDRAQEENCRAYAEQKGLELLSVFIDLDLSGKNSKRCAFQQMLDLIETGVVDIVLVNHLDRTYRNGFSFAMFMSFLDEYFTELISVSENLDSRTFSGRLTMMLLAATAEMPIWAASERSREAKGIRFRLGLHNGGYRLGYCNGRCSNCTDPNGKDYCPLYGGHDRLESKWGRLQVAHPIEQHAVRLVISCYQNGMSDQEIADYINNHRFELPDGTSTQFRTKGVPNSCRPGRFTRDSVRDIVRNPFYIGYVAHYPTPALSMSDNLRHPERIHVSVKNRRTPLSLVRGQHEPLYPMEIWKQNQQCRSSKKQTPTTAGKPTHLYLLTGVARCAECYQENDRIASLRGSTNGSGNQSYRCATLCDSHHSHRGQANIAPALPNPGLIAHGTPVFDDLVKRHQRTNLPAVDLEAQATALLQNFTIPTDWYDRILAYMFSDNGMSDFELHGQNLRRELERYKTLYLDGHISQDEYEEQARRIKAALENLKPHACPEAQTILPLLADFPALWAQMTPLEQRTILRDIFSGLYFDGTGALREARPHAAFKELLK